MHVFQGDKKASRNVLWDAEQRLVAKLLPGIPKWLETYHLTLCTMLWGVLVVAFSLMAKRDIVWIWAVSGMVALQYITDVLDGAVGRTRRTGLIRWGFVMDHFLDYAFLSALMVGYLLIMPSFALEFILLFAVFAGYMVHSYLSFGTEGAFEASYYGVSGTEGRIFIIVLNAFLFFAGLKAFGALLPFVIVFWGGGLLCVVFRTHRRLWSREMRVKFSARYMDAPGENK